MTTSFEISILRNSTVWLLYRMRDRIQLDPEYQRLSEIWTMDKRQLLIDTILNDFDVPKLYLHKFRKPLEKNGRIFEYAIIDGKQRLESIWSFIDGRIALADDFEYFKDEKVKAGGMKYMELGQAYPDLKAQLDGFTLSTVYIETDDIEVIEEMFTRLNEAATLTAAEKRNAFGGPLPVAIRQLAKEEFFVASLPFRNKRYRHYDLAAKFLLAEHEGKVGDTKKVYLDKFVERFRGQPRQKMPSFVKKTKETMGLMVSIFTKNDPLLRQVGMVMLYYHLFRLADNHGLEGKITRKRLLDFEKLRDENRITAEANEEKADYDLIEFDKYAQSPNDGYAIKFRLKVLLEKAFKKRDVGIESL